MHLQAATAHPDLAIVAAVGHALLSVVSGWSARRGRARPGAGWWYAVAAMQALFAVDAILGTRLMASEMLREQLRASGLYERRHGIQEACILIGTVGAVGLGVIVIRSRALRKAGARWAVAGTAGHGALILGSVVSLHAYDRIMGLPHAIVNFKTAMYGLFALMIIRAAWRRDYETFVKT